jgi:hypothetical protein
LTIKEGEGNIPAAALALEGEEKEKEDIPILSKSDSPRMFLQRRFEITNILFFLLRFTVKVERTVSLIGLHAQLNPQTLEVSIVNILTCITFNGVIMSQERLHIDRVQANKVYTWPESLSWPIPFGNNTVDAVLLYHLYLYVRCVHEVSELYELNGQQMKMRSSQIPTGSLTYLYPQRQTTQASIPFVSISIPLTCL